VCKFESCDSGLLNVVQDGAEEAGTTVNGGQTILNPWMTVGGAATSICQPNEYIM